MKLYIDVDELKKSTLPKEVLMYLVSLYLGYQIKSDTAREAFDLGLCYFSDIDNKDNPIDIEFTQRGVDLIESLFLNSEFGNSDNNEDIFSTTAVAMQELFPKGKKPGTNYMWRDSKSVITQRLKLLAKKYDIKLDKEAIINATQKYVNSFNGDYTYMQLLKYFIFKKNNMTGEEVSQLLSYMENLNQANELENCNWRDNVR